MKLAIQFVEPELCFCLGFECVDFTGATSYSHHSRQRDIPC